MERFKKYFIQRGILYPLLLGLLATFVFVYWSGKKEIWFCDEVYTYETANGFEQGWPTEKYGEWISREEMVSAFAADSDTLSLDRVIENLYGDHVPLYFWIFRVVSFLFFHGSSSLWIGFSINLVCYLLLLFLVFTFLHKIRGRVAPAVATVMVVIIGSRLCLEQAMYLRMYMLLLLLEVAFLILCLNLSNQWKWYRFFLFCVLSVAGFLTHYTFWIFYGSCFVIFCIGFLCDLFRGRKESLKNMFAWIANGSLTILIVTLVFPVWKRNLGEGRGEMAVREFLKMDLGKRYQIKWGYRILSNMIFGKDFPMGAALLIAFACITGAAILLYKKGEKTQCRSLLTVVLITQLQQWMINLTVANAENRYLWACDTLFMLCFVWSVTLLFVVIPKQKIARMAGLIGLVVVLFCEWKIVDGGRGLEYLRHPDKDLKMLSEYADKPWIMYGPTLGLYSYYDWTIPERIVFLSGENTPKEKEALGQIYSDEEMILYVYEGYVKDAVSFLQEGFESHVFLEKIAVSGGLTVYHVEVN